MLESYYSYRPATDGTAVIEVSLPDLSCTFPHLRGAKVVEMGLLHLPCELKASRHMCSKSSDKVQRVSDGFAGVCRTRVHRISRRAATRLHWQRARCLQSSRPPFSGCRPPCVHKMHALSKTSRRKCLASSRLLATSAPGSADAPVMNRYSRTVTQPKTQGASQARHTM
jgi:hypothetical protein